MVLEREGFHRDEGDDHADVNRTRLVCLPALLTSSVVNRPAVALSA